MLFTDLARSILGESVPLVPVPPLPYGIGQYSRHWAQFLPIQTFQPVNNIYSFCLIYRKLATFIYGTAKNTKKITKK